MRIDMQNMITIYRANEAYVFIEIVWILCVFGVTCGIDKIQKSH